MRLLRTVGGLLLAGALLVVVMSGLNGTGDAVPIKDAGKSFFGALWNGLINVINRVSGGSVGVGGVAGDATAAFGVAALVVVGVLLTIPVARAGRGFAITVGMGVALGLLLYSPGILDQVPTS